MLLVDNGSPYDILFSNAFLKMAIDSNRHFSNFLGMTVFYGHKIPMMGRINLRMVVGEGLAESTQLVDNLILTHLLFTMESKEGYHIIHRDDLFEKKKQVVKSNVDGGEVQFHGYWITFHTCYDTLFKN